MSIDRARWIYLEDKDLPKEDIEYIKTLEEEHRQRAIDDDEAVLLANEKGLPFALDHLGYDGLGNIALEERKALRGLLRAIVEMWADEWGGGIDWILEEPNGPQRFPEVVRSLEVLGLTWHEFIDAEGWKKRKN